MDESEVIKIRKEKAVNFLKKNYNSVSYVILAVIVYIAVKIRISNLPGLKDITTGTWTLGPDLDPFLFLRWAKYIVEHGSIMAVDTMRYVPLGFNTSGEYLLLPYSIAWFHKLAVLFGSESVTHSAVLYPAFMFGLTVIAFFLMTRKIFVKSLGELPANIIALVASFFLSVIPVLLPRTIAGIPEKESVAFLFMFLAFYFFLSAWSAKTKKSGLIFALLAGISTAAMAHTWGGYIYIFFVLGPLVFIAFIFDKIEDKEFYVYATWILSSFAFIYLLFFGRFTLLGLLKSPSTAFAFFTFFIIFMHRFVLSGKEIRRRLDKGFMKKIPSRVSSVLISLILALIIGGVVLGPSTLYSQVTNIKDALIQPAVSRLIQTVAENRQPYFTEWEGSFGPHFYGVALVFWLFFIGSVVLFYSAIGSFNKRQRAWFTASYVVFLLTVIFSRYSANSSLNGVNGLSLFVYSIGFVIILFALGKGGEFAEKNRRIYYGSFVGLAISLLLMFYIGGIVITSITGIFAVVALVFSLISITNQKEFKEIKFESMFILVLFFFGIISARAGVRFIMVLAPPAAIIISYLVVKSYLVMSSKKKENMKIFFLVLFIVVLVASVFSANIFYKSVKSQAQSYVPSVYTQQWQKAMAWTRENTPQDAVFGHWWDYGYWLQSIGERATVLDGGNNIAYWNHLMGRYALTGPDETEALEFLYAHGGTHFLIDSTDIGKYSAFSTIGSDVNYDRASYIPTILRDAGQVQEKKNSTVFVYSGGIGLDADIVYEQNGTKIFLPSGQAGLGGVLIERNSEGLLVSTPTGVYVYQGRQHNLPLRYAFDNGELIDFGEGLEAGVFVYPSVGQSGNTLQIDPYGAMLYLSGRTVNSQLARIYLYEDANSAFKLVHSEDDFIVGQIKAQNPGFESNFVYYGGLRGPIRIWEIEYPDDIAYREEFIETHYPEELYIAR